MFDLASIAKGMLQIWLLFCLTAHLTHACDMPGEIIHSGLEALCHYLKILFSEEYNY